MSNIYIQEPPALGKVLLKTTAGEIDIELWTKEAPKACRNFIQLCMEGYYNGTVFHRVVPDFIVQGGDPNGDGTGGESIYGAPFKDEFHSRLRFSRRGLVASANAGKDDNASQFFFTLAATPELQNKHTIFGKVTGETIYNMLKLSEGLIGPDDRPEHPHKITTATVLINPFTDIVPRVTEKEEVEAPKKRKREGQAVKNFGLLSFGEEAEEDEGEAQEYRGKPKSTHDLLEDPKLSKMTAAELEQLQPDTEETQPDTEEARLQKEKKKQETEVAVSSIRDKLSSKMEKKNQEGSKIKQEDGKKKQEDGKKKQEDGKKKQEDGKKRGSSVERDAKKKKGDSDKKIQEESESSEEEYYLGKERDMQRLKERDRIRTEIKQLRREMKESKDEKIAEQKEKEIESKGKSLEEDNEMYKEFIEEQEKYKKMKEKIPKKGAAREDFTLQLLAKFKTKLHAIKEKSQTEEEEKPEGAEKSTAEKSTEEKSAEEKKEEGKEDENLNTDDWLGHKLRFEDNRPVLAKDASTKGDDWFDIYDPRNPINKRKREKESKKARK